MDLLLPLVKAPGPPLRRAVAALVRHRLTHFLLGGAALFAAAPRPGRAIELHEEQLRAVYEVQGRRKGSALTAEERQRALDRLVEDELLHREGLRLGFDQEDAVVRARVIQKMLFHAEDAAGAGAPADDGAAEAYHRAHPGQFERPGRATIEQVFLATSRHGEQAEVAARRAHEALAGPQPPDPASLGDGLPGGRRVDGKTERELASMLGDEVARAAFSLPVGAWSPPLRSGLGWHVLRVVARTEPSVAPFADVRRQAQLALQTERKRAAVDALLRRLSAGTPVVIHAPAGTPARPSGSPSLRVAERE